MFDVQNFRNIFLIVINISFSKLFIRNFITLSTKSINLYVHKKSGNIVIMRIDQKLEAGYNHRIKQHCEDDIFID